MALLRPPDEDDVAPGVPDLSDAQLGSVAEDRLATAILLSSAGTAAVAFPLLDLGFDLYPRRIRTLRAHPVQVKARSFLERDGESGAPYVPLHGRSARWAVIRSLSLEAARAGSAHCPK